MLARLRPPSRKSSSTSPPGAVFSHSRSLTRNEARPPSRQARLPAGAPGDAYLDLGNTGQRHLVAVEGSGRRPLRPTGEMRARRPLLVTPLCRRCALTAERLVVPRCAMRTESRPATGSMPGSPYCRRGDVASRRIPPPPTAPRSPRGIRASCPAAPPFGSASRLVFARSSVLVGCLVNTPSYTHAFL